MDLYNNLLSLSRNLFFYQKVSLADTFETRIYLMFLHFSIFLRIYKKKEVKFNQKSYDHFFNNIENNLRELGFGDVSVNKKMKELNKVFYDILLKFVKPSLNKESFFILEHKLISKYFSELKDPKSSSYHEFETYFSNFYDFCFELPLEYMVRDAVNFRN